jgi:hypothetical protein
MKAAQFAPMCYAGKKKGSNLINIAPLPKLQLKYGCQPQQQLAWALA